MAIDKQGSLVKTLGILCLGCLAACSQPATQQHTEHNTTNKLFTINLDKAPDPRITDKDLITISAVGDIMLGGTSEPVLSEHGYDYPFARVKHLFNESDVIIGNLEGPLTHQEIPYSDKEYLFKTPPELVAPALKNAGFTLLNLANNHIMDFGVPGMRDTIEALRNSGMQSVGVGSNLTEARKGIVISVNDKNIGFLSYSLTFPKSFWATDTRPGTAFGHEHQIRSDVKRLKAKTDLVVVSFHWGREKSSELREYQPILAHAAIDEGASLIIGHHPHVLQAVEQYKHGVILYSLGNFTFGSYSQAASTSVVANISYKENIFASLELNPIKVLNIDVNFQPQLLSGPEADEVIDQLNEMSIQRNTYLRNRRGIAYLSNTPGLSKSLSKLD